jgi:transposase
LKSTCTARSEALEIGDWTRFSRPAKLAGWLGLVPRSSSRGSAAAKARSRRPGSGYARRLLVEAAWHYLPRPSVGPALAERRAGQPDHVLQVALRAQRRLHRLHQRLRARGKPGNVTTVALTRELACFLWAAAVAD